MSVKIDSTVMRKWLVVQGRWATYKVPIIMGAEHDKVLWCTRCGTVGEPDTVRHECGARLWTIGFLQKSGLTAHGKDLEDYRNRQARKRFNEMMEQAEWDDPAFREEEVP